MNPGLIVNLRSGIVHRGHSWERCNVDDVAPANRRRIESEEEIAGLPESKRGWRFCSWCYPEVRSDEAP